MSSLISSPVLLVVVLALITALLASKFKPKSQPKPEVEGEDARIVKMLKSVNLEQELDGTYTVESFVGIYKIVIELTYEQLA
jgi:hypothetical protein